MHLATIDWNDTTSAAVVRDGWVAPLVDETGRPLFADLQALLATGAGWPEQARNRVDDTVWVPLDEVVLRRPVLTPGATICVGANYREHIREMGSEFPAYPTLFSKLARALTDHRAPIELPACAADHVDYEGELVLVMGSGGRCIRPDRAWDAIAGVTIANDVSMRDFQTRTTQWFAGKSWERSTPVGPVMATPDELPPLERCHLRTLVNGELRQDTTLDDLLFDIPALVASISTMFTLYPGDLILTGTGGGVGHALTPPQYLKAGDRVEVTADGVGILVNDVRSSESGPEPDDLPFPRRDDRPAEDPAR
jgi:acylpyruvate hydrolase